MTITDASNIIQKGREFITSEFGYEEVRLDQYAVLKGFVLIHFIYYSLYKKGVYHTILLWSPISQQFTILEKVREDAR